MSVEEVKKEVKSNTSNPTCHVCGTLMDCELTENNKSIYKCMHCGAVAPRMVNEIAAMDTANKQKPTYGVGVSVLIVKDGKLLLTKRKAGNAAGWYATPGGRIEQDENAYACAVRETLEETGMVIANPEVISVAEHFRFGMHYFMIYIIARTIIAGAITNKEPDKHEDWEWISLYNLPEKCTEPVDVINRLKEEYF